MRERTVQIDILSVIHMQIGIGYSKNVWTRGANRDSETFFFYSIKQFPSEGGFPGSTNLYCSREENQMVE